MHSTPLVLIYLLGTALQEKTGAGRGGGGGGEGGLEVMDRDTGRQCGEWRPQSVR